MGTTRTQIADWFTQGKALGATHLIVVCDTFDHTDYPVYVLPGENVSDKAEENGFDPDTETPTTTQDMKRVMEIYSLAKPMEVQLDEAEAFHLD